MPNFIENLGLGFIYDEEEITRNFFGHLIQNGKVINGYYGWPNLFNSMGDIDFYVKTKMNDEGNLEVVGLDTHCCGRNLWELRNTGMDLTPKDSMPTERLFMFKNHADGSGMLPIHIINADVLPSFLEDDVVSMQMCAFPLDIYYYADEDDYANNQPESENGKSWLLADGALMPVSFLHNHQVRDENNDIDYSTDDHVLFRGTVKRLEPGIFEFDENKQVQTYIRCVIDTPYGELHFAHTIDQIDEEQRDNIKVGSIVFGICVLSGDVAIYEYDQGIVKDFDHNFNLLRQVIVKGQADRMRSVLCEDAVYISDASEKTFKGIDEIVDRFNYVHEERKDKTFVTPATIISIDEELEYPVGTRCLLISHGTEDDYRSIAFLNVNEEGNINRIHITTDSRYHFKADEKICDTLLDDLVYPKSIIEPIYNRAKFHGLIDDEISLDKLVKGITNYSTWQNNAENMLYELNDKPKQDVAVVLENLFGYLFVKAIEMTINGKKRENFETVLVASYSPEDAFEGKIFSELDEENHSKLASAMELGKQFYKDFNFFTVMSEVDEGLFDENLMDALVIVQHIGTLYAEKLFG